MKKEYNSFRQSKAWKDFRKQLITKQKTCALTGRKLLKGAHCHHMDMNKDNYKDLSNEEHFIMLNKQSHDIVHFFHGKDWRTYIENLTKILEKMEEINS